MPNDQTARVSLFGFVSRAFGIGAWAFFVHWSLVIGHWSFHPCPIFVPPPSLSWRHYANSREWLGSTLLLEPHRVLRPRQTRLACRRPRGAAWRQRFRSHRSQGMDIALHARRGSARGKRELKSLFFPSTPATE